jgi:hypothetical protein
LQSQEWSNLLWALATLQKNGVNMGSSSNVSAIVAAGSVVMEQRISTAKPQSLSNTLWALATLGWHRDDSTLTKLVTAMVQRSSTAKPQDLSNTLWALATLGWHCDDSTLTKLVTAMVQRSSTAMPQALSNTLWALATLGWHCDDSTLTKLVTAMVQRISAAKPQELSNTLWALATLGWHCDDSILTKLVTAMEQRVSTAKPQELSNTLWALGQFEWYNAGAIKALAAAIAQRNSESNSQCLSNTLQALGSLRWYDAAVYSQLVGGLLQKSSSSNQPGQHFSNALFSCALSSHFDSSVDALAAWGSQQDLRQWNEQEVSNTLSAWAMLTAIGKGGDTTNLRSLAQQVFKEASSRGAPKFTVGNDLGKLASAHWEAQHVGLPGGGLSDSKLLQAAEEHQAERMKSISEERSSITREVAEALQGYYEVQAAMVHGYHVLQVPHPSCPRGVVLAVTQRDRDYLRHPARQMYGKAALRMAQVKRRCDVLVLCDESELSGSIEQQRGVLLDRLKEAMLEL